MYDGTHSITFGDGTIVDGKFVGKNTWKDWFLIPNDRPDVASPGVKTNFVEIPGRDGTIDMSEYLTGHPTYSDRSGSWSFIVDNDHIGWETLRRMIVEFLHGRKMKCVLEDDPGWYFQGRFQVKPQSGQKNSAIEIEYVLEPYKRYIIPNGDWLWDPFNFETDRTDAFGELRM